MVVFERGLPQEWIRGKTDEQWHPGPALICITSTSKFGTVAVPQYFGLSHASFELPPSDLLNRYTEWFR